MPFQDFNIAEPIGNSTDITLRDYQHALRFYRSGGHDFAPKVKFLYHVVFELTPEAYSKATTTSEYEKIISVLVKNADLPGYSASVDTKNQYNRKKNIQTRIDYDPVNIRFHDDNLGITTKLFEEYYRFYFRDGSKFNDPGIHTDFEQRDLYRSRVPTYGMDQKPGQMFFKYIKIFQMARQEWTAYTLINPIIEKWQHDNVDYSAGGEILENSISVRYEGVLYSRGNVSEDLDPRGFANADTMYDITQSPIGTSTWYPELGKARTLEEDTLSTTPDIQRFSNSYDEVGTNITPVDKGVGGYPNIQFPQTPPSTATSKSESSSTRGIDSERNVRELNANPSLKESVTRKVLASGNLNSNYSVSNLDDYNNASEEEKAAVQDEVMQNIANGDKKSNQIASNAIKNNNETKNKVTPSDAPNNVSSSTQAINEYNSLKDRGGPYNAQEREFINSQQVIIPKVGLKTREEIESGEGLTPRQQRNALKDIDRKTNAYNDKYNA